MSKSFKELFFVEKYIKLLFSQFNDIKLVSNHFCICWRILLASFLKFIGSGFEMIKLVPSANKTILLLLSMRKGRSFMYRKKSKGSSIDPWGTPWVVLPHSESEFE